MKSFAFLSDHNTFFKATGKVTAMTFINFQPTTMPTTALTSLTYLHQVLKLSLQTSVTVTGMFWENFSERKKYENT